MPLSTLRETPRDVPRKTRGQDGFATSFPVGLLHPLQHAGLARRTPVGPSSRCDLLSERLNLFVRNAFHQYTLMGRGGAHYGRAGQASSFWAVQFEDGEAL